MQLPFFYAPDLGLLDNVQSLAEDTARHIAQVLRMNEGDLIHLTDGRGRVATARIVSTGKKTCTVHLQSIENFPAPEHHCTIAVSLLKNAGRFEWLLEKAAELGINTIVPLVCQRTERQQFREDRLQNILVSAMLQSRQAWLTEIATPIACLTYIGQCYQGEKYIAHCDTGEKTNFASLDKSIKKDSTVLIGPEGDFTPEEIQVAIAQGFKPISLGNTRLRTETAAIVAAVIQKQWLMVSG
jgi:16S rRNA (uracil1498-N3)-methyltransferase